MATRFYSSVKYGSGGTDSDVVYYNANIINNATADSVGNVQDPQVTFSESRQQPILRDTGDYMMSVIQLSYSAALQNLPVFIPRIQQSQPTTRFRGTIVATSPTTATLTVVQVLAGSINRTISLIVPSQPGGTANFTLGGTGTGAGGTYLLTGNTFSSTVGVVEMEQVLAQPDVDLTIYSLTVENPTTGNFTRKFLRWIPANAYIPPPSSPVITQTLSTEYYYAYNTATFVAMFNAAYWAALIELGYAADIIGCTSQGWALEGHVFGAGDGDTFFLGTPRPDPDLPNNEQGINIYFNTSLETLLTNFPGVYLNQDFGKSFRVNIVPNLLNIAQASFGSQQIFPSTDSWSPVSNLTVTSSLLPITLEQCATPATVGSSSSQTLGVISPGTYLPVVCDTVIPVEGNANRTRSDYVYEPTAEYRMISLNPSSSPLTQIDFQVWWRNRLDNQLYPLRLVQGSSVTIKVMFRRKQMGV